MIKTWSTPVLSEDKALIACALCEGRRFEQYVSCENFYYVRCSDCGLVQINPQPEKIFVHKRYNASYLAYELSNEKQFLNLAMLSLHDADLDEIERRCGKSGTMDALDVGCATGALAEKLRERGWNVQGVEISHEQADYARKKRGITVSCLPLEENNFNENSFDLVIASHLIEHLTNPALFVAEVFRIIKRGGNFIVITPNVSGLQAKLFRGKWRSAIFDHLYLFSVTTLKKLLTEKGFLVEKIVSWGGIPAGAAPSSLKRIADKAAKYFGIGDVMLMRCLKSS